MSSSNKRAQKNTDSKSLSEIISTSSRDDVWLLSRLDFLWTQYFSNVSQDNPVYIRFGRYSRFRLGSIRLERHSKKSFITVTGMFKDPNIPVEVVDHTIAHELCHYAHGFSSTKPRLHKFPHHGGVIKKELESRGMYKLVKAYAVWLDKYRQTLD
jgi:hypothetical protein